MLKIVIDYPGRGDELAVLDRMGGLSATTDIDPVLAAEDLEELRQAVDSVYVDPKVKEYIVDVVRATRKPAEYGLDIDRPYSVGGQHPCRDRLAPGGQGPCFPSRPGVRDARRREDDRHRTCFAIAW